MNAKLRKIATSVLKITTFERTYVTSQDFHDLPIWLITEALEHAYRAGYDDGRNYQEGEVYLV